MSWDDIRGHDTQLAMFRRAIARGRVAHAYLFLGPPGVGKRLIAHRIAQCLFCQTHADSELRACGICSACKQVKSGTHSDLMSIGLPPGKRELPISLLLGEPDRRGREGLLHDLSLRPMSADRRIAIIDDADRMNDESANALLKTLEEPPPGRFCFSSVPARMRCCPPSAAAASRCSSRACPPKLSPSCSKPKTRVMSRPVWMSPDSATGASIPHGCCFSPACGSFGRKYSVSSRAARSTG
ncbi:MAG: ATP-binding protein [Planctomycetaceae bacterium]